MKYVILNDKKYELIENVKEGYNQEEVESKLTDYFDEYDYVVGDKDINAFSNKDNYIKNSCAYGCRYFVLERIND